MTDHLKTTDKTSKSAMRSIGVIALGALCGTVAYGVVYLWATEQRREIAVSVKPQYVDHPAPSENVPAMSGQAPIDCGRNGCPEPLGAVPKDGTFADDPAGRGGTLSYPNCATKSDAQTCR